MEGRNNQNSGNNNTTVINQRVRSFIIIKIIQNLINLKFFHFR